MKDFGIFGMYLGGGIIGMLALTLVQRYIFGSRMTESEFMFGMACALSWFVVDRVKDAVGGVRESS
jgi:hypothetical protein